MKKPAKGARRIVVSGREYYWLYRGARVVIWANGGKKYVYTDSELSGWSNDSIERGKWKKYFSITPKDIADWISEKGI